MQYINVESIIEAFILRDGRVLVYRKRDGKGEMCVMTIEKWGKFTTENNLSSTLVDLPHTPMMSTGTTYLGEPISPGTTTTTGTTIISNTSGITSAADAVRGSSSIFANSAERLSPEGKIVPKTIPSLSPSELTTWTEETKEIEK